MKNDLIYQCSEYDCGPTSLINAIRFLYEREEIDPVLIRGIYTMGNDTFGKNALIGRHGTSKAAMRYMADWFNDVAMHCRFPIRSRYADGETALIYPDSVVVDCLKRGGCVVLRCWSGKVGHYVLLTGIDGEYIRLWDPYDEVPDFDDLTLRRNDFDHPKSHNRIILRDVFNLDDKSDYAMGGTEMREALLIWREDPPEERKPEDL